MFKLIKDLFAVFTLSQRRRVYSIQLLVVLMALVEVISISSMGPFMALVGNISLLDGSNFLAYLYKISNLSSPESFLFLMGGVVLFLLTMATFLSMYTVYKMSILGATIGTELSDTLYSYYMRQNWIFHSSGSSAQLTKQVTTESIRISDNIIYPLLHSNAKCVLTFTIAIAILIYNPIIAILALGISIGGYVLLYRIVRTRLKKNGVDLSETSTERFRLMNEGFGGIKDIILMGRRADFINRFQETGRTFAFAKGSTVSLSLVPRYFMELIAFGTIITLILVLLKVYDGDLGSVLPILAIYAFSGFKLLPALQQIYGGVAQIRGHIAAFENVKSDLIQAQKNNQLIVSASDAEAVPVKFTNQIQLNNVSFSYPEKSIPALKSLNMTIHNNKMIGIVGASGSGKSTLMDMILGLIKPQEGEVIVDNERLTADSLRSWQNQIGFVPQSIFLSEGSIAENIAFGISKENINLEQVKKVIELAHLTELIQHLPDGMNTKVGERGVQLSGGQRQRIGIARALYNDANILVFDEATSSLDGVTEKYIMEAINTLASRKTIIIVAHRLKTVKTCDSIVFLKQGEIIDQGTYEELNLKNPEFRKLANHA